MTTIKSHLFTLNIALLGAKCFCGRQVIKRQAAANAVLCTVGNVVLEKNLQGIWRNGYGPQVVGLPPLF